MNKQISFSLDLTFMSYSKTDLNIKIISKLQPIFYLQENRWPQNFFLQFLYIKMEKRVVSADSSIKEWEA